MGNLVSLLNVDNELNYKDVVEKSIDLINYNPIKKANKIIIKPNLCYYWDSKTGYTTDPLLVKGIVDLFRERYGNDVEISIAEADASAMKTKYAFDILGYRKLFDKSNVELLNLSKSPSSQKEIDINGKTIKFSIPNVLLESDIFVNVPKLKLMRATYITCAMKNLFGAISEPRKIQHHTHLNEAIVAVNKVLKPHLNIVDGIVVLGRHPLNLNLVMTSQDCFSIDWIASIIAGYNPKKIHFLKIAKKEKVGDSEGIITVGENIEDYIKRFPKEGLITTKFLWDSQFKLLNIYSRIVGDIVPPFLLEE